MVNFESALDRDRSIALGALVVVPICDNNGSATSAV